MPAHKWQFAPRFRRQAFGWRSDTPIQRIKEAMAEIKAMAKKDPLLAAEGAVLLLEKLSPALEQVDSSSGAIGSWVNRAIDTLVPIIAAVEVPQKTRQLWLERLWEAVQEDGMSYIEGLGDHWGVLCAGPELAAQWADDFLPGVQAVWSPSAAGGSYFQGSTACLASLLAAGRHQELLALLETERTKWWHYRQWGVKALVVMGKKAEAIRYAEELRGQNDPDQEIAQACEAILLSSGLGDAAYERYAIKANQCGTHLATYRTITKKYPHKAAPEILRDLVASTPGAEGKWFAAAKEAGLFAEAIALVQRSPADPRTLTRAANDFADKQPAFAMHSGLAALRWIANGDGYEITGGEVLDAWMATLQAARNAGVDVQQVKEQVRAMVVGDLRSQRFVHSILGPTLT
ncbi:MAG: hypothetical protein LH632_05010 [Rhodoferax sp.]|nr:hypothetical protein [Rhodoferax sp.]